MIVKEFNYSEEQRAAKDYQSDGIRIEIDGVKAFEVHEGEPEDMTLGRNLNDCVSITTMLRQAFDAGANGETFELSYEVFEDD
jgi:hypothetical protein